MSNEKATERLLLMGAAGAGKSRAVLSIAGMVKGKVWVLDTELDTYDRMLKGKEELDVETFGVLPDDWEGMKAGVKKIAEGVGKGDWVVVDSMTPTWSAVQNWFVERVFGDEMGDYFMRVREEKKEAKSLAVLEGWVDWSVINAQYAGFVNSMLKCVGKGANLLWTAEVDVLGDADDRMWGKAGVKPRELRKSIPWGRGQCGNWCER